MSLIYVDFTEFQQNHGKCLQYCREKGNLLQLNYAGDGLSRYVIANHAGANELLRNEYPNFVHFVDYFAAQDADSETDRKITLEGELDGNAFWPHVDTIGGSRWPGQDGGPPKSGS